MNNLIKKFTITDSFWGKYERLIAETVIPYQEKALRDQIPDAEKSHAIENFELAAHYLETGKCEADFYGMVFQDSDLAKWIEAAAYVLVSSPNPELEKRVDGIIALIGRAQHEDGYLNTYFTVKAPDQRWTNLHEAHELYCAGHMMEAAVAYFENTGKRKLLTIMMKMTEHIYKRFITDKAEGYPGHPEVELALLRMYRATDEEKCLELAAHFINVRGVDSDYFKKEVKKRGWKVWGMDAEDKGYAQNQAPLRELKEATGHAVRAVYLYTAMADLAATANDESLKTACMDLWENITKKQMYVTGGIGSTCLGEAFSTNYHLPNDTAYAETCASIGLIFFARKMLDLSKNSDYADVMERALYNCVLAGMQLDGTRFFYVNPLEVIPGIAGEVVTHKHALPERPKWFGCACCPPNIARLLPSLASYAWSEDEACVYSHLFMGGKLDLSDSKKVTITMEGDYINEGRIIYHCEPAAEQKSAEFTLAVRIPAWSEQTSIKLNGSDIFGQKEEAVVTQKDGYVYITKAYTKEDRLELLFDMEPKKLYANTAVSAESGMTAFQRGPLVYCVEGTKEEEEVLVLRVDKNAKPIMKQYDSELLSGIAEMEIGGFKLHSDENLYSTKRPKSVPCRITAIPYYAWGNRGLHQMRVWMPEM